MRPFAILMLAAAVASATAAGAQPKPEDPIPPGSTGKVLPLRGKVLQIVGLASAVSGRSTALGAALQDLGAKTTEMEVRIELSSDVLFDFDKDTLKPEAVPTLEKVVTVIQGYPGASTTVEGHSDSVGADDYNQRLSERRARSVEQWLRGHGVTSAMTATGFGETKPVAPNTNPDGSDNPANRQKNRRVEIVVRK
jgi:outer membrane protein OmpA-like peptidoglycan-associated protein